MKSCPDINEIYNLLLQEENQRGLHSNAQILSRSVAMFVQPSIHRVQPPIFPHKGLIILAWAKNPQDWLHGKDRLISQVRNFKGNNIFVIIARCQGTPSKGATKCMAIHLDTSFISLKGLLLQPIRLYQISGPWLFLVVLINNPIHLALIFQAILHRHHSLLKSNTCNFFSFSTSTISRLILLVGKMPLPLAFSQVTLFAY